MRRAAGAALLLAAGASAAASAASPWQWELSGRQDWQHWRETGADGRRLVAEDGRLSGVAATLRWAPPQSTAWAITAAGWQGVRDYEGLTNRGQSVRTRSDLQHALIRTEVAGTARPLASGWQWQPTAALELWQWRRELRGVDNAAGYPERYRQGVLLLGAQAQTGDASDGWRLRLEAGGGPGGVNRLQLPGRDVASLPLGVARSARVAFGAAITPAWRWDVEVQAVSLAAGAERAITLQGVPLQAARQPHTTWRRGQLQLSWVL